MTIFQKYCSSHLFLPVYYSCVILLIISIKKSLSLRTMIVYEMLNTSSISIISMNCKSIIGYYNHKIFCLYSSQCDIWDHICNRKVTNLSFAMINIYNSYKNISITNEEILLSIRYTKSLLIVQWYNFVSIVYIPIYYDVWDDTAIDDRHSIIVRKPVWTVFGWCMMYRCLSETWSVEMIPPGVIDANTCVDSRRSSVECYNNV